MQRRFSISDEDLEKLGRDMTELPPPPEPKILNKREAIRKLRPALEQLRARGYGFDVMARMLQERGFPTSAGVLRAYWTETRPESDPARVAERHRRSQDPARGSAKEGGVTAGTSRTRPP